MSYNSVFKVQFWLLGRRKISQWNLMYLESYQNSLTFNICLLFSKRRDKARITVIIMPCAFIFGCELDRVDRCYADRCKWLMFFIEWLLLRPMGLRTTSWLWKACMSEQLKSKCNAHKHLLSLFHTHNTSLFVCVFFLCVFISVYTFVCVEES